MKKISTFICKHKIAIIVITCCLFLLSLIGIKATDINYDILVYLPEDIETVQGQNILAEDFNMGGFSIAIIDNMKPKDILSLEEQLKNVDGVNKVVTGYDIIGTTIPIEMLPSEIASKIKEDKSDLLLITFEESTSSEKTLNAVEEIKDITKDACKVGGMSSLVLDTMNLSNSELAIYIIIAVILCIVVLELSLDSYLVPFILLANIGISIIFNMGSNVIFGEISYITKALAAVLQLGVTTDFSIFLYHAYEKKKKQCSNSGLAMSNAINDTFRSVAGSALTTMAGFLVLCTMNLTLGKDLGLVMAKGVLLGIICVLTVFPSLLLLFDKWIEKTKHKSIIPKFDRFNKFVIKHHVAILVIFLLALIPAYLGYSHVEVYYKIDKSLPDTLDSIVANQELKDKFNIVSPEIILLNKDLKTEKVEEMVDKIEEIDGIDFVLSFSKLKDLGISESMLSKDIVDIFESDRYQMLLLNSTYDIATTELNNQIGVINQIIKEYDANSILAGEGPLMNDLVSISDQDFMNVNSSSIICILIIMFIVLQSFSLPFILIITIEFAIFLNMSVSYFGGIVLPFVAPIVLGTIQLGATIDYAILMTSTYLEKRKQGLDKKEAMLETTNYCGNSILVSGMCFFAATFGVGVYSKLEMVGSLCTLISRGAIISMIVVLMVLPSLLLVLDKVIIKTTKIKKEKINMKKKLTKTVAICMIGVIMCGTLPVYATSKNETVYTKLNSDGSVKNITVSEQLYNIDHIDQIEDMSDLENILNINSDATFLKNDNIVTWEAKGKDIFYQGTTNKEVPVKVLITYYLDGKEMPLSEILGKSGKITLRLRYQNNDKHLISVKGHYESLYTPFVVTMGTVISNEFASNVTASNGKVINNGNNSIVVGIAAPGLYDSLKLQELKDFDTIVVEYETTKFELSSIYSVITPKLLDSEDLKVFDKLDSLYNNVDILTSSMDKLENGAKELVEGSKQLNTGAELISDNLAVISSKIIELKNGSIQLDDGLNYIISELEKASSELNNSASSDSISSIKTLMAKNNEAIKNLTDGNQQLKNVYETYHLKDITLEQAIQMDSTMALYNAKLAYENNYELNTNLIILLTSNNKALEEILINLESISMKINDLIDTLTDSLKKIETGANTLKNGASSLESGITILADKSKELSNGINSAYNGTQTLKDGITTFNNEGISVISSLATYANDITNKIDALVNLGNSYQTFTMKSNGTNGDTKFVYVVDAVKVPKEEKKLETTVSKETLWTRIKNLFK